MELICKKMPKIDLHAHLNGSLSAKTLETLGCLKTSVEEYQRLTTILEKSSRTLDECFDLFKVAHDATKNKTSVYKATASVIEEFSNDNCVYLELRTTPRAGIDMTKREYIETVVAAIRDNANEMLVKLLLCIDRRHDYETSLDVMKLIVEMRHQHPDIIVGVDLCGNPNEGTFPQEIFQFARTHRLYVTIHCAEIKNDAEALAILKFAPNRIGHGTFLHPKYGGSEECWNAYVSYPIPLEACLTSNVICGTSKNYENHHLQEWIKNKLPFSLSTDDKGVFCSDLSNEYFLAQKFYNLSVQDLWDISYASIDQSFASPGEKLKLKGVLEEWRAENNQHFLN